MAQVIDLLDRLPRRPSHEGLEPRLSRRERRYRLEAWIIGALMVITLMRWLGV